jgi:pimeloyl-ACP methyl ester carboxylesterase
MTQTLALSDGRQLSYDTYGDQDGKPVIFSHGLSDSHVIRNPDDALTASLGVRWIAADQPGVGGSSPQPGRHMVDWGSDMEELADALGLGAFNVAGHSGGGPHTLAIAARLPDRVGKVALASPVAPFDEPGVTKMLVMKDLKLLVKIRHLHRLLRWAMRSDAKKIEKDLPGYVDSVVDELPDEAKTMLRTPEQKAMFEENFRQGYIQEEEGVYEMMLALWDWGFAPSDVPQPVDLFYGDADDIISPKMPQHLCEELPNCSPHLWSGAPHYGFVDRDRWIEFVTAARGGS